MAWEERDERKGAVMPKASRQLTSLMRKGSVLVKGKQPRVSGAVGACVWVEKTIGIVWHVRGHNWRHVVTVACHAQGVLPSCRIARGGAWRTMCWKLKVSTSAPSRSSLSMGTYLQTSVAARQPMAKRRYRAWVPVKCAPRDAASGHRQLHIRQTKSTLQSGHANTPPEKVVDRLARGTEEGHPVEGA